MSLRLPTTRFQAVLNLGPKTAAAIAPPATLGRPEIFGDWDEETGQSSIAVEFASGQIHLDTVDGGIDYHFHRGNGSDIDRSPWPDTLGGPILNWASVLLTEFHQRMPDLLEDLEEAAAWNDEGYTLFICEVEEPTQLDLITVDIEGELLTLPWLGSGRVDHDHIDGDNHPIALMWYATEGAPEVAIAEARLDPDTELPVTRALPGIDWEAVGMPADEVLSWLEGIYLNHHVLPDAVGTLLTAALERMGGVDGVAVHEL
ncbi:hypothetical protein ASF54_06780 [Frondihabitans sp. Leaf304]|nr:hypothetical protein ASF54_06780 [Frondihabitans sp. Leaf304]RPE78656.1 hypothetical protein EDF37_1337 [Frondihabitans sp. PhB153]RPF08937.1 hypothetical protein EDF39_1339 [Frondihabitans sp. PhB161]